MPGRVLVDHQLQQLLERDWLFVPGSPNCPNVAASFLQPASLDLPVMNRCFLVKDRVLPYKKLVSELIQSISIVKVDLGAPEGAVLLKGQTYLAHCGRVKLPAHCRGSLSPKSSIGRVDVMVRGVFDGSGLYDTIGCGEEGDLWIEISPRSFNVRLREFQTLSQMMIFSHQDGEEDAEEDKVPLAKRLDLLYTNQGISIQPQVHFNGAIILHLGLTSDDHAPIGWEALATNEVVDLSQVRTHELGLFFRPLHANSNASVTLEKDRFYILATQERISVPTSLSAEMIPFSHHIGELRAHYAGFFDPGFGFPLKGTGGVLEVRPHETVTIFDGQPICLIEYFRNLALPAKPYGQAGNNYQSQRGAKLAKYFQDAV